MSAAPRCPRCGSDVRAPGLMTSAWTCAEHGSVHPFHRGTAELLAHVAGSSRVPVWVPRPMPGWTLGGVGWCGDDRSGAVASVVALGGPSPLGGPADLVLVAEEPGVGLGARLAGADGVDPGDLTGGAPEAKVLAAGHPTPLWRASSSDSCAAFVGEAAGVWLWAIAWPGAAELVLMEHVDLHDQRDDPQELVVGAPTARLP